MKPQLAVSYPDKINRHQFGGDCHVLIAEDENVIDEDPAVKRNRNTTNLHHQLQYNHKDLHDEFKTNISHH